jgi:hypothetical protein
MKKIVYLILSIITFIIFNNLVNATESNIDIDDVVNIEETWDVNENVNVEENIDITPISMWVNSTDISTSIDITNIRESSYIYYYGQWCAHCADVDEYLKKTGGYWNLDIIKKEVWSDKANALEMSQAIERLWLNASEVWVPFIVVKTWETESYLVWSDTIINYFKPYLWEASETSTWETSNKKIIVLVIFWILAVVVSTILIKLSNKN